MEKPYGNELGCKLLPKHFKNEFKDNFPTWANIAAQRQHGLLKEFSV